MRFASIDRPCHADASARHGEGRSESGPWPLGIPLASNPMGATPSPSRRQRALPLPRLPPRLLFGEADLTKIKKLYAEYLRKWKPQRKRHCVPSPRDQHPHEHKSPGSEGTTSSCCAGNTRPVIEVYNWDTSEIVVTG